MTDSAQPKTQFSVQELIELLEIPEEKVMKLASELGLKLNHDFSTQTTWFSESDYQMMKRYKSKRQSMGSTTVKNIEDRNKVAAVAQQNSAQELVSTPISMEPKTQVTTKSSAPVSINNKLLEKAMMAQSINNNDLVVAVDAVSRLKEILMQDFSQVLDQKLGGLDDLVIELIKSRCQLEQAKEELSMQQNQVKKLEDELAQFKPAAFGFWKKESSEKKIR